MFQELAFNFSNQHIEPYADEWDQKKHFPLDTLREAAGLGFGGIYCSDEYGGSGLGRLEASLVFEALATGCPSLAAFLSIHNMVCKMIDTFASKELKEAYLPSMCTMERVGSYCLTEPNSGSDAQSLQTTAKKDGDDLVINGTKMFISGGSASDIYLVMTRTGEKEITCILVEKGTKGLTFGKNERKMGWNCQPTTAVILEDVRVPKTNIVGKVG
mmetsp:Transcript_20089/g.14813  ORF Transcript_20089/g.14813 Transcript_20089/m.14813 type:complete len:215 (+) Transcript_20089:113-757(+)